MKFPHKILVALFCLSFFNLYAAEDPCTCTCTTAENPRDNWGHCVATSYGDECESGSSSTTGCDGDMCVSNE